MFYSTVGGSTITTLNEFSGSLVYVGHTLHHSQFSDRKIIGSWSINDYNLYFDSKSLVSPWLTWQQSITRGHLVVLYRRSSITPSSIPAFTVSFLGARTHTRPRHSHHTHTDTTWHSWSRDPLIALARGTTVLEALNTLARLGVAQPLVPLQIQSPAIDPQVRVRTSIRAELTPGFPTHRTTIFGALLARSAPGVGRAEPPRVISPGGEERGQEGIIHDEK